MSGAKKYGLIIKKKPKENQIKKASVFGNDSSGEEDATSKRSNINVSLLREADKKKLMKQTQIEIEKAIREDPTVYQYDNVYDEMAEKKKAAIPKLIEKDKKPKYIENLLKSARSRKMEEERRIERQTHKEREKEGGEFQDKEEFVTSAYRKRMIELAEEEKQLKKKEALDAANDVTKRSDLTMFYSNLLRQNVSMGGAFEAHSQDAPKDDKPDQEGGPPSENKERTAGDLTDNNRRSSSEHSKNSRTEDRGDHSDSRSHREDNLHSRDKDKRRRSSSDEEHYRKRRDDDKERVDDRRESRKETQSPRSESFRRPDSSSRKLDRHDSEKRHSSEERSRERDVKRKSDKDEIKHAKEGEPGQEKQEIITSSKFSKRSNNETVSSARERFLERKRAREMTQKHRPKDDSDED